MATRTGAAKPADFSKVIVDTTVQPKAVAFPTDAKLMHRARERLVRLARKTGVELAPVLRAGRQACADRPPALRPRQAVQARQPGAEDDPHLSRPGHRATSCARSRATPRWRASSPIRSCSPVACELRRRSAVEPVIGHAKTEHRMGRNYLAGTHGDAANAVLAAAGYNFRRLLEWRPFAASSSWRSSPPPGTLPPPRKTALEVHPNVPSR